MIAWLLALSVALSGDGRIAVVSAPPATAGTGSALTLLHDAALVPATAAPDAFQAIIGQGGVTVTSARSLADLGAPARTVLAFDQSGSFKRHWNDAFQLAATFASALPPAGHRVEVVTFGVSMVAHGDDEGPAGVNAVLDVARRQGAIQGSTRLRNFIREAVRRADAGLPATTRGLRQVVVFTDAGEESTTFDLDTVISDARTAGVAIHVVAFYKPGTTAARRLDEVKRIAEDTGGAYIQVDSTTPGPILERLARPEKLAWWLDVTYCGVDATRGPRFDDTLSVELWSTTASGRTRLATSPQVPFRQEAAGAAVQPCGVDAIAAPAPTPLAPPAAPRDDGLPAWVRWVVLGGGLLLLALSGLALLAARRKPVEAAEPEPAPAVSLPPPLPDGRGPNQPFAPVQAKAWDDPTERLPDTLLSLTEGPAGLRAQIRLTRRRTTIGAVPGVDIVIDVPQVSSRHATLELFPDGSVWLTDEASTNGTFLDGKQLRRGERVPVRPGQLIGLSRHVTYALVRPAAGTGSPGEGGHRATMVSPLGPRGGR